MKIISEEKVIEIMSVPDIFANKHGFIEFMNKDVWTWSAVEDFVNEPFYSMEILHDIHRKIISGDKVAQMNIDKLETQTAEESMKPRAKSFEIEKKVIINEWNGEGLPPVGVECELKYRHAKNANWRKCKVFAYSSEHGSAAAVWHLDGEIWHHHSINTSEYEFRKPETPEQREERERLEAAYDLYCTGNKGLNVTAPCTFDAFESDEIQCKFWLAIVDKTNYRKESN